MDVRFFRQDNNTRTLTTSECVAATALIPPPIPLPILPLHDGGRDPDTIPTGKPLPKALVVVGVEGRVIAPPCIPQVHPTLSISCKLTLARKFVAHSTMVPHTTNGRLKHGVQCLGGQVAVNLHLRCHAGCDPDSHRCSKAILPAHTHRWNITLEVAVWAVSGLAQQGAERICSLACAGEGLVQ